MGKVLVDREVLEQIVDAAFSPYCSQNLGTLVPALRAALEKPGVEPVGYVESNVLGTGGFHVRRLGSAKLKFGDELFAAPQPAQQPMQELPPSPITEEMHVAACKVLTRAHGLAGTPQRMLDAMRAAAPQPAQQNDVEKEALLRALHSIDTVVVSLSTFQVNTDGGIDAAAANIVAAIKSAADLLEKMGAAPKPAQQSRK